MRITNETVKLFLEKDSSTIDVEDIKSLIPYLFITLEYHETGKEISSYSRLGGIFIALNKQEHLHQLIKHLDHHQIANHLGYQLSLSTDTANRVLLHALSWAIKNNDLTKLKQIESIITVDRLRSIIALEDFQLFITAAEHGHEAMLKTLKAWTTDAAFQEMMITQSGAHPYNCPFTAAIQQGHLNAVKLIYRWTTADERRNLLAAQDFIAIKQAALQGHIVILQQLYDWAPADIQAQFVDIMLERNCVEEIIRNNDIDTLRQLYAWATPEQRNTLITKKYSALEDQVKDSAFFFAIKHNRVEMYDQLHSWSTPEQYTEILSDNNYQLFWFAVESNYTAIIRRILNGLSPEQRIELLAAKGYKVFRKALENNNKPLLRLLCSFLTIDQRQQMVSYTVTPQYDGKPTLFVLAARRNNIRFLRQLYGWATPEERTKMIIAPHNHDHGNWKGEYRAFNSATASGQIHIAKQLYEWATPQQRTAMITTPFYVRPYDTTPKFKPFLIAAQHGDLAMLQQLYEWGTPEQRNAMLAIGESRNEKYSAFSYAAKKGHLNILKQIYDWATTEQRNEMILVGASFSTFYTESFVGHKAFEGAIYYGHLDTAEQIYNWATPEQKASLLTAERGYNPVASAIHSKNVAILNKLRLWCTDQQFDYMLGMVDFSSLLYHAAPERLLHREHANILTFILKNSPAIFSSLDGDISYREYISAAILEILEAWLDIHTANELSDREATLGFYILRNLIRNNDPDQLRNIHFLINIPAIRNKCHLAIENHSGDGEANELLKLALRNNNQTAAEALMAIPAVYAAAEANNFYEAQTTPGGLNLRTVAGNAESSMRGLDQAEEQILQDVVAEYRDTLMAYGGVDAVFEQLQRMLKDRYEANPATITIGDVTHQLPFGMLALQHFRAHHALTEEQYQQALQAYYQHPDHTAACYLSKPNEFISQHAQYVRVNPTTGERWADYEEFKPLIAYLFLAVIDKNTPPVEGHSFDSRLEHFIRQLASCCREHNWDKSRPKKAADGSIMRDEEGEIMTEEYDDGEPHKPTCRLGTKLRLFYSVQGHRLFCHLTSTTLKEEIREFARAQLTKFFNELPLLQHKQVIDDIEAMTMGDGIKGALLSSNISEDAFKQFKLDMTHKWQEEFSDNAGFQRQVNYRLTITSDESHTSKFFQWLGLEKLITSTHTRKTQNLSYALDMSIFGRPIASKQQSPVNYLSQNQPGIGL